MPAQGPGEAPPVVVRRARRVRRQQQRASRPAPVRPVGQAHERPTPPTPSVRPAARQPRPVQRVAAKPLQARPPRHIRAGKPVTTKAQARSVRRVARQQASAAAADRARAIAAVSRSGGEFSGSARSGPGSDAAAARTAKRIGHDIHVGPDGHYYAHVKRDLLPDLHVAVDPFTGKHDTKWEQDPRSGKPELAAVNAPALKILDQTTRPIHAIAASELSDIKRGGVKEVFAVHAPGSQAAKERRRAVRRGFALKDRTLSSDVLKAAGVKSKAVAGAAGFVLDVAQDPTTIVTGGVGSVERKAAEDAAKSAARRATAAGMSEEGVQTVARAAAKRVTAKAPAGKGVTVRLAGHEVPGVRRATAAVSRAAKAPVRKVAPVATRTFPAGVRRVAREVAPSVRQANVSEAVHTGARQAARQARASVNTAEARAMQLAQDLRRNLSDEDYARVADAVDRNDFSKLTPELAKQAHRLRSALKGSRRVSRRAGVAAGHTAGDMSRFLSKQDLGRLDKSVAAEQRAQKRAVSRSVTKEQASRERALLTEQEQRLRSQGAARVEQVRVTGRAAVSREKQIASARTGVVEARRRLKVEVAKPVTKRRGVAALEANVRRAEEAWRQARRPVNVPLARPVAQATGQRAGQAAERYSSRSADAFVAEQRLAATTGVPKIHTGETHAAYLNRVIQHADRHDLPLVKARAQKLLAKVPQDVARGYFPREFEPRVLKKLGLTDEEALTRTVRGGPSRTVSQTTAGFARNEQRALRTVNPERVAAGKEPFSTNVPLVTLNHLKSAARAASQGEFAKHMAALGRKVSSVDDLEPGEGLFKLGYQGGKFGLHEVRGLPTRPTRGGQYVALDRRVLDDMQSAVRQVRSGNPVGQVLDRVTGRWKRLATATPGFHLRNLVGDTSQAYLAAPGQELPRNIAQAGKAVRRVNQQAKSLTPPASHATIKVGGARQPIDQFVKAARENGVLDAGYIGREVHDLVEPTAEKAGRVKRTKGTVNRWMTNRENLMRLATYKAGLDRGMKPAEAADLANHFHIDYGDLSDTERRYLRRVFPFYTWTARTLPVMAKALVTQPGKFATIEKAREETSSATGLNEAAVRRGMSEAIARQVPFVVKVGNGALGISASLPVTLLNELPTGTSKDDLSAYLSELGRFGFQMLNPLFKVPIEEQTGTSLYTKRPIEDPQRPLTAAPSWVRYLPGAVKRELEVTPNYIDKRTGKKTWGWRGQADYVSRQLPGAPQQVSTVVSGGRPGQPKDVATAVVGAAGVRVDSLNAAAVKHTKDVRVLERLAKLNRRAGELNQQGINSDHPTPEYTHLRKQINGLTKQVRPRKTKTVRKAGPLPLGGGSGGKLPLGGGSGGKLPL